LPRIALKVLRDLIEEGKNIILAVLPTGYGKSSFMLYNKDLLGSKGRFIHILPLRVLVRNLYKKYESTLKDDFVVSYQADISIPDAVKSPFLVGHYVITTYDSFTFNFFGFPVAELWKCGWHSDVSLLFARCSNYVLDEIHLIVNPDADLTFSGEEIMKERSKIFTMMIHILEWCLKHGNLALILTATMFPSTLIDIVKTLGKLSNENLSRTLSLIVFAHEEHPYVRRLAENLPQDILIYFDEHELLRDPFYSSMMSLETRFNLVKYDMSHVLNEILSGNEKLLYPFSYLKEVSRILICFNSAKRAIEYFRKYANAFKEEGFVPLLLHGRMTRCDRNMLEDLLNRVKRLALFATQVVEAGLDMNFDLLVTEICSPLSLIQRIGRVARYGGKGSIIVIGHDLEKLAGGVYDLDIVRKMFELLASNKILGKHWRIPSLEGEFDFMYLLHEIDRRITNSYVYDKSVKIILEKIEEEYTEERRIELLLENFKGSFVRQAMLIPLFVEVFQHEQLKRKYEDMVITTSTEFLRYLKRLGNTSKVLEFVDNNRCKVAFMTSKGIIHKEILLDNILENPIGTFRKVILAVRRHDKSAFLLGILCRKDSYRPLYKIKINDEKVVISSLIW